MAKERLPQILKNIKEDKSMGRKADVFAGKDTLAYRLMKRRKAIESGNLPGMDDDNEVGNVVKRGYSLERDE